jgi:hypothetical protein
MKSSVIITTIVFSSFLLQGCLSYRYSNKTKNEEIKLLVKENPDDVINRRVLKQPQADPEEINQARGMMVGEALSLATEGVKLLIEMDKQKYTASYQAGKEQLYFYNRPSVRSAIDPLGMQFDGFYLLRLVKNKQSNIMDTALYISLSVDLENPYEIINNSIFRLKVDSFYLNYSKAKIPGFRWYLPWTIMYRDRNKINLDMEMEVTASWVSQSGHVIQDETIGVFTLFLRDVPLDADSDEAVNYARNIANTKVNGYSFLVPRSYGFLYNREREYVPCWGQGNYNISIKVNESGKEDFVTKLIHDNSEVIVDELGNSFSKLLD